MRWRSATTAMKSKNCICSIRACRGRRSSLMMTASNNIFYLLAGNQVINRVLGQQIVVPQRDVLHIRLSPNPARQPYPLVGEPPLLAAVNDMAVYQTIMQQQLSFYGNEARPSAVLSTDLGARERSGSGAARSLGRTELGPRHRQDADPDLRPQSPAVGHAGERRASCRDAENVD